MDDKNGEWMNWMCLSRSEPDRHCVLKIAMPTISILPYFVLSLAGVVAVVDVAHVKNAMKWSKEKERQRTCRLNGGFLCHLFVLQKNGLLWFRDFCIAVQLISAHTGPKALCCTWFEQKQRSSLGAIEISLVRKCFESSPKRKIGRIHIVCTWHVHDSANWIKTHD